MKEKYLLIIVFTLFFSCEQKENKTRFFIGNNEIIEVDKVITIYSLRDSTRMTYRRNKNKLLKKNEEHFKYTLQDSIIEIIGENYHSYNEFTNKVSLIGHEKCWDLDDEKFDVTLCLNNGKFRLHENLRLYEEGEYLVLNDFDKYFLFRTNSTKFFSDSFYIIDILNDSIFSLIDSKTKDKVKFTNANLGL